MRAFTNGHAEVLIAMSVPDAELLQEIVSMAANGVGGHRSAQYIEIHLARALNQALPCPADEVEEQIKETEKKAKRDKRS